MAPPAKYRVKLTDEQREDLREMTRRGEHNAREIRRARTLLLLDKGRGRQEVAKLMEVTAATITATAKNFCNDGLEQALFDARRAGRPAKLTKNDEARITAIACSEPPEGHAKWTAAMIRDELLVLTDHDKLSSETIRLRLKKTFSSPGNPISG